MIVNICVVAYIVIAMAILLIGIATTDKSEQEGVMALALFWPLFAFVYGIVAAFYLPVELVKRVRQNHN